MDQEKMIVVGVALAAGLIGAGLIYMIFRAQIDDMVAGAKAAATKDILTGAAEVAAAADETLAAARDPDATEKAIAAGTF
jgi:hypothetical protein